MTLSPRHSHPSLYLYSQNELSKIILFYLYSQYNILSTLIYQNFLLSHMSQALIAHKMVAGSY